MKRSMICVSLVLALMGCKDGSNSPSNPKVLVKAENEQKAATSTQIGYGSVGAANNWPQLEQPSAMVSNNLLAKNYYIVLDGSGSMDRTSCGNGNSRIDVAKDALTQFVSSLSDDTQIGLYVFDEHGSNERAALDSGAAHKHKVIDFISKVQPNHGTPLGSSISQALRSLNDQAAMQLSYGDYNLVIVTDGVAGDTPLMNSMVDKIIVETPINIHTIGFCIDDDHALNRKGYVNYQSAQNAEQLLTGLGTVTAEAESFDVDTEFKE
ncbi:vWA domain-containing protein [Vibrio penaeicida]|uniref:VWFA domain-containing protein n=1 Tax=Vibrio penaeicida TaxID=104609 RepID=A0AAV5NMD1_9VIBR|nr:vWA domain-containing protein [Vibrio penaeicida]RTZ24909.1 VWA domain-containing protein [Vibrio penaeicida]GLQ71206.1 hypothetical protein GCM10007932_05660 [Vibrio penaeicida]